MQRAAIWMLTTTAAIAAATPAYAQSDTPRDYDIAPQSLGQALQQVALVSGQQVVAPSALTDGVRAPAVKGRLNIDEVVAALLRGTGLHATLIGKTLVIKRDAASEGDPVGTDILVTGTRIRGRAPVGSPVITINRKAILDNGFSTTQQIAQSIPQNFAGGANEGTGTAITGLGNGNAGRGSSVNLRGLGQSSTLVLLNGDRPPLGGATGTFADISMIPASAIERVEIVPDGASAIYGSDAVAGVVNVIPRLNFTGAETSLRIGTADGDSQEIQASQLFGKRWSSGHFVIAYEYYRRDRLSAADRDYATDDLRAFGGPDNRVEFSSPGTIYAGGRTFAIPRGQNGVGLTAARLTPGTLNLGDSQVGTDLLPEQRRHSVFAAISQELTANLRVYARGLASFRTFDQAIRSEGNDYFTVPVTNPFYVDPIGTRQPVDVQYNFDRDLGNQRDRGTIKAYGGTGGIEGKIGRWTLDAHGTWGEQSERYLQLNLVNTARLAVALADTNSATSYNLFGDGPSTNPATIARVRGSTVSEYSGVVWSLTTRADGPLFALPGGEVSAALGGEYREDRYREAPGTSDVSTLVPVVSVPTPLLPLRTVKALYGELLVPVFGGDFTLPGVKRLEMSAAVRAERYSDFGSTTNPKFGATWQPFTGLTIRGSYGKSFRAPLSQELRQDPGSMAIFAFRVPDPAATSGQSNIIVIRGNDPKLRPERATTWSLGADFRPAWLNGLRASVTYFNVDYRDRIATPASQLFSVLANRQTFAPIIAASPSPARVAELFASPIYRNFLGIPSTATFVAVVDARTQNLSVVKQNGLDLDLAYAFEAGVGHAEVGAVATHIFHIDQGLTATAPTIDVVNTTGNPIDLRVRGHASWTTSAISTSVFVNYAGDYTNKTVSPFQPVSSWTTVDLNIAYTFKRDRGPLRGLRIALNATNIFDRDPPFVDYETGASTNGYDAENASPIGRVVALQLTKSW